MNRQEEYFTKLDYHKLIELERKLELLVKGTPPHISDGAKRELEYTKASIANHRLKFGG